MHGLGNNGRVNYLRRDKAGTWTSWPMSVAQYVAVGAITLSPAGRPHAAFYNGSYDLYWQAPKSPAELVIGP